MPCAVAQQRLKMHPRKAHSSCSLGFPLITYSLGTERERKQDPGPWVLLKATLRSNWE